MRYWTFVLFFLGSGLLGSCNVLPQITKHPQKRDDAPFTMNIGPVEEYQKTTSGVMTPSGSSIALYPTDVATIPTDGKYLLIGPDMHQDLQEVADSSCATDDLSGCLDAVMSVLEGDEDDLLARSNTDVLLSRQVEEPIVYGLAGLVSAAVIAMYKKLEPPKGIPVEIHLPSSALSQLEAASTASEMLFKTASDDARPLSASIAPIATSYNPLQTMTSGNADFSKGDIELDAPNEETAKAINDIFQKTSCPTSRSRRDGLVERVDNNVVDCLLNGFTNILDAMGVNEPLQGLTIVATQIARNFPLPTFVEHEYAAAFGQALVAGADGIPRVINDIAQDRIVLTTTFIFLLSAANVKHKLMQDSKLVLAQAQFLESDQDFKVACPVLGDPYYPKCDSFICKGKDGLCTASPMSPCPCRGSASNCPDEDHMEVCSKCNGIDLECTSGDHIGCDCMEDRVTIWEHPIEPLDWLDTLNQISMEVDKDSSTSDPSHPAVPQPGPIVCKENTFQKSKCWNDIHAKSVNETTANIGAKIPNGDKGHVVDAQSMRNVTNLYREKGGKSGVTYMANIGWIPGCTSYPSMVADNPQGKSGDSPEQSISCTDIIWNTYAKCTGNNGLGGYQDYGCLRYGFYPSDIPEMMSENSAQAYWDADGDICGKRR